MLSPEQYLYLKEDINEIFKDTPATAADTVFAKHMQMMQLLHDFMQRETRDVFVTQSVLARLKKEMNKLKLLENQYETAKNNGSLPIEWFIRGGGKLRAALSVLERVQAKRNDPNSDATLTPVTPEERPAEQNGGGEEAEEEAEEKVQEEETEEEAIEEADAEEAEEKENEEDAEEEEEAEEERGEEEEEAQRKRRVAKKPANRPDAAAKTQAARTDAAAAKSGAAAKKTQAARTDAAAKKVQAARSANAGERVSNRIAKKPAEIEPEARIQAKRHKQRIRTRALLPNSRFLVLGRRAGITMFSKDAVEMTRKYTIKRLTELLATAFIYANHARRKTLTAEDVKNAAKQKGIVHYG